MKKEEQTSTAKVVGKVLSVSTIPDSKDSDYPSCLSTVLFEIDSVKRNANDIPLSKNILLLIDAFQEHKPCPMAGIKQDDCLEITICANDDFPECISEMQKVDDIERIDLDFYYCLGGRYCKETELTHDYHGTNAFKYNIHTTPLNEKQSQNAVEERQKSVDATRERIFKDEQRLLNFTDEDMGKINGLLKEKYASVNGNGNLFFFKRNDFLFSLKTDAFCSNKIPKKGIVGLTSLAEYLKFHNIDLIVAPLPSDKEIAFDELFPEYRGAMSAERVAYMKALTENGIEVIDSTDELREYIHSKEHPYKTLFYYLNGDYHPAEAALAIHAKKVAKALNRYDIEKYARSAFSKVETGYAPDKFTTKKTVFFPEANEKSLENIPEYHVYFDGRAIDSNYMSSPFLVMGNSFTTAQFDLHAFQALLAVETGYFPSRLFMNGGKISFIANEFLKHEEHYLQQRKAMILVCAIGHLGLLPNFTSEKKKLLDLNQTFEHTKEQIEVKPKDIQVANAKKTFGSHVCSQEEFESLKLSYSKYPSYKNIIESNKLVEGGEFSSFLIGAESETEITIPIPEDFHLEPHNMCSFEFITRTNISSIAIRNALDKNYTSYNTPMVTFAKAFVAFDGGENVKQVNIKIKNPSVAIIFFIKKIQIMSFDK